MEWVVAGGRMGPERDGEQGLPEGAGDVGGRPVPGGDEVRAAMAVVAAQVAAREGRERLLCGCFMVWGTAASRERRAVCDG